MRTTQWCIGAAVAGLFVLGTLQAPGQGTAPEKKDVVKPPTITGDWTGTWGNYQPGAEAKKPDKPMRLDCKVADPKDGAWKATFEGECGRPYKYTIQLAGRQAGDVVLFKGTVDLGEKDGGVYDWIGRATEQEFVGFYTSQKYTGTFRLTRPK